MSDQRNILTILRDPGYIGQQAIFARAADEIERLKAALREIADRAGDDTADCVAVEIARAALETKRKP